MSQALRHPMIELPRNGVLRIAGGQPHVIDVFEGEVWLTQDGDPRDVILEPGESFRFDGDGLTLVQAFRPSRLLVSDLADTRAMNATALHRLARAQRDAAVAALVVRGFAAAESAVLRLAQLLVERLSNRAAQRRPGFI